MRAKYERLKGHLKELKLNTALVNLDFVLEQAMKDQTSPTETLEQLLSLEVQRRFEKRVETNYRLSGLPVRKRIEDFDFEAQPGVPKAVIQELSTLRFVNHGENVLLIGSCGVGKTHLAIGLALKAIEAGHRVGFVTAHALVSKVRQAHQRQRLDRLLTNYLRADILILDELGFLPFDQTEANFLFELVNTRYQKQKPMIITSNKVFSQWEKMFPDRVMAVALLDRLLHHGHALQIQGESYRLKHRRDAGLTPQST